MKYTFIDQEMSILGDAEQFPAIDTAELLPAASRWEDGYPELEAFCKLSYDLLETKEPQS